MHKYVMIVNTELFRYFGSYRKKRMQCHLYLFIFNELSIEFKKNSFISLRIYFFHYV